MAKVRQQQTYKKLIDTTTAQPGSGGNFTYFGAPYFDGSTAVFYGCNAPYGAPTTTPPTWEGIYAVSTEQLAPSDSLVRISDNHTNLPTLNGCPTSNPLENLRAYIQATTGALLPQSNFLLGNSRPVVLGDYVAFFAANWADNAQPTGIFLYNLKKNDIQVVASTAASENFAAAQFWAPSICSQGVYFTASSPTLDPGVYLRDLELKSLQCLLDITKAQSPSDKQIAFISQSHCIGFPLNRLYLYGQHADWNEAIFSYDSENGLRTIVKEGLSVPGGTISAGNNTFWTELAIRDSMLAFNAQISSGGGDLTAGLFVMNLADTPEDIPPPYLIINASATVPGGNTQFDGNQFATPPVADGKRVVYTGAYFPPEGVYGEQMGLFVWSSRTNQSTMLMNSNDSIDGKQVANFIFNTGSFVDGKLVCNVFFADNTYGIYLFDLTEY